MKNHGYESEECVSKINKLSIIDLFLRAVDQYSSQIAIVAGEQSLTYAELKNRVEVVARALQKQGVTKGDIVAVGLNKSLDTYIAYLATLRCGAIYAPIDLTYPADRLNFILNDLSPKLVVVEQTDFTLPLNSFTAFDISNAYDSNLFLSDFDDYPLIDGEDVAYIMYTSGSTGTPKGVRVKHSGVVRLVHHCNFATLDSSTVSLQHSSPLFDASTLEIWAPLLNGGRLIVPTANTMDLHYFANVLQENSVNILWLTAGLFNYIVDFKLDMLENINQLLVGGDVVSPVHVNRAYQGLKDNVTIINGYGPTENTTFTCCYTIPRNIDIDSSIPIGKPINGTFIIIENEDSDEGGELLVGGLGLAEGYHRRDELTAEKFIHNEDGNVFYRTGDLVKRDQNGNLVFLSRCDQMVKIRGYRIELQEIEQVLLTLPKVLQAVVVVEEYETHDKRLFAYVIGKDNASSDDILKELASRLPAYMLPNVIEIVDALPLTNNGKIDRRVLKGQTSNSHTPTEKNENSIRSQIREIFQSIFRIKDIKDSDDFFDLGGDSLLVIDLIASVKNASQIELSFTEVFDNPTIEGLVEIVEAKTLAEIEEQARESKRDCETDDSSANFHDSSPDSNVFPASIGAQSLWFINQISGQNSAYHTAYRYDFKQYIDRDKLEKAINTLADRQESLKSRFEMPDDVLVQIIDSKIRYKIVHIQVENSASDVQNRLEEIIKPLLKEPFDLENGPLYRFYLVDIPQTGNSVFVYVAHHIVCDEWSRGIFNRELNNIFSDLNNNNNISTNLHKKISLAEVAEKNGDYFNSDSFIRDQSFWQNYLNPLPTNNVLVDATNAEKNTTCFFKRRIFSSEASASLFTTHPIAECNSYTVMLGAYYLLLANETQVKNFTVGTAVSGRGDADFKNVMGYFANIIPFKVQFDEHQTVTEYFKTVRTNVLQTLEHQQIPFASITQNLRLDKSNRNFPLVNQVFTYQSVPMETLNLAGGEAKASLLDCQGVKFPLSMIVERQHQEQRVCVSFEYDAQLYSEKFIENLLAFYESLLTKAIKNQNSTLAEILSSAVKENINTPDEEKQDSRINKVKNIWCKLLSVDSSEDQDNFFDVGGHSLLLMKLIGRVSKELEVKISFEDFYSKPELGHLIKLVLAEKGQEYKPNSAVPTNSAPAILPFTSNLMQFSASGNEDLSKPAYSILYQVKLEGNFDSDLMQKSISSLMQHCDPFCFRLAENKTSFYRDISEYTQTASVDISNQTIFAKEQYLHDLKEQLRNEAWVIPGEKMCVCYWIQLDDKHAILLMKIHHLIFDGHSMTPFLRLIDKQYSNGIANSNVENINILQWGDVLVQRCGDESDQLDNGLLDESIRRYIDKLIDHETLEKESVESYLNSDLFIDPLINEKDIVCPEAFTISPELQKKVDSALSHYKITPTCFYLSAFSLLLNRVMQIANPIVNVPFAGRDEEHEEVLGYLVNVLPILTPTGDADLKSNYLLSIQQQMLLVMQGQHDIAREIYHKNILKGMSGRAFAFSYESQPEPQNWQGINVDWNFDINKNPKYKMHLTLQKLEEGVSGYFIGDSSFNKHAIAFMKKHFLHIVEQLTDVVLQPLAKMPITPLQYRELLNAWNNTEEKHVIPQTTISEIIHNSTLKHLDSIAIKESSTEISYAELNEKISILANRINDLCLSDCVVLEMDSGANALIAMLAVWRAGKYFSPIEKDAPLETKRLLLSEVQAGLIISDELTTQYKDVPALVYNYQNTFDYNGNNSLINHNKSSDIACIIFTAGSTGASKGVIIEHGNLRKFVNGSVGITDASDFEKSSAFASITSDLFLAELFPALCVGGTVVFFDKQHVNNQQLFIKKLHDESITHCFIPPNLLTGFVQVSEQYHSLPSLKRIQIGVEPIHSSLAKRLLTQFPNVSLINAYGPTEATTLASYFHVNKQDLTAGRVPVGRAIYGQTIKLVDEHGELVPIGACGEIVIEGGHVARGYLHHASENEDRFKVVTHKDKTTRQYRTGDHARYLPNGQLEYRSRANEQIKIRGHQVDLNEVRLAIKQSEYVADAFVTVLSKNEVDYLVAYVAFVGDSQITNLQNWLITRLPAPMIPSQFSTVDAFEYTSSGKIDANKLPEFRIIDEKPSELTDTSDEIQCVIINAFRSVFDFDTLSLNDDFYSLGGDSVTAIRLCLFIENELAMDVPMYSLLSYPVVRDFVTHVKSLANALNEPSRESVLLPVSAVQESLWAQTIMLGDNYAYNVTFCYQLNGSLDEDKFSKAISTVLDIHEQLLCNFREKNGNVYLVNNGVSHNPLIKSNLTAFEESEQQLQIQSHIEKEQKYLFNLENELLVRIHLLTCSDSKNYLIFNAHHLVVDGFSVELFWSEVNRVYTSLLKGENLVTSVLDSQYQAYVKREEDYYKTGLYEKQLGQWVSELEGVDTGFDFPLRKTRPIDLSFIGSEYRLGFSKNSVSAIKNFYANHKITPYVFFLCAYTMLCKRYSNANNVVVGTPMLGRPSKEDLQTIGYFVNTLPLNITFDTQQTVLEVLELVANKVYQASQLQRVPYAHIVKTLKKNTAVLEPGLFNSIFSLISGADKKIKLGSAAMQPVNIPQLSAKYDISFAVETHEDKFECLINYSSDLIYSSTAKEICQCYINIVESMIENPQRLIEDIQYLNKSELSQQFDGWNPIFNKESTDSIAYKFSEVVNKYPDNPAIVGQDTHITYAQLEKQSNFLANTLMNLGIGSQMKVAVLLPRSPAYLVTILAIAKLNAIYIPISTAQPFDYAKKVLENSQCDLFICDGEYSDHVPSEIKTYYLSMDDLGVDDVCHFASEPESRDKLINIMYTSGSTGTPKGVKVYEKGITRLLLPNKTYEILSNDRVYMNTDIGFDVSSFEIWVPLLSGACLVFPTEHDNSLTVLGDDLVDYEVTVLWASSGFFNLIVDTIPDKLTNLRYFLAGGDVLSLEHIRRAKQALPAVTLINGYGPTENSVFTTAYAITDVENIERSVPIGYAIPNSKLYILNSSMQPVQPGVVGELYVAGDGVAQGYYNLEGLTQEKFVKNPFSEEDCLNTLYKTGDLVRCFADGKFEFMGREDKQVKINGIRIELTEIQFSINSCPLVKDSAVTTDGEMGSKKLVAYVVFNSDHGTINELKSYLTGILSFGKIPTQFHVVDEIPININGKPDLKRLQPVGRKLKTKSSKKKYEKDIYQIWSKLLDNNEIGLDDNFFEVGGCSIKAIKLNHELQSVFNIKMKVSTIFSKPTIRSQSEYIKSIESSRDAN